MTRLHAWIRNYFGFSRTETNGFLILLPLMGAMLFSAPLYRWWFFQHTVPLIDNSQALDSIISHWHSPSMAKPGTRDPKPGARNPKPETRDPKPGTGTGTVKTSLFIFDPNKATLNDFLLLGIDEKLARRIINYRTKGGMFKLKKDLGKIYGMDTGLTKKLYAYIDLPEKIPRVPAILPFTSSTKAKAGLFDINQADTSQFIRIYGIGPKLSMRIIAYRERLGGFVSMKQLREIYGLDTVVSERLKIKSFIDSAFIPKQININTADKKQLKALPYITFNLANAIAAYRFQHGDFKSLEELKQSVLINDQTFQKIKPYLTIKD